MEGKGTFFQDASSLSLKNSVSEGQTAILEQSEHPEIMTNCSSPKKDKSSLAPNFMTI